MKTDTYSLKSVLVLIVVIAAVACIPFGSSISQMFLEASTPLPHKCPRCGAEMRSVYNRHLKRTSRICDTCEHILRYWHETGEVTQ